MPTFLQEQWGLQSSRDSVFMLAPYPLRKGACQGCDLVQKDSFPLIPFLLNVLQNIKHKIGFSSRSFLTVLLTQTVQWALSEFPATHCLLAE